MKFSLSYLFKILTFLCIFTFVFKRALRSFLEACLTFEWDVFRNEFYSMFYGWFWLAEHEDWVPSGHGLTPLTFPAILGGGLGIFINSVILVVIWTVIIYFLFPERKNNENKSN